MSVPHDGGFEPTAEPDDTEMISEELQTNATAPGTAAIITARDIVL